jgi:uroporphyrinogen-III decarboxylase
MARLSAAEGVNHLFRNPQSQIPNPMTGRQRLHAALKGEPVDRVPFAINLWQWFYANQYWGRLPEEKRSLRTPIEFLIDLGADILTRWDGQIKGRSGLGEYVRFPNAEFTTQFSGEAPPYPLVTAFNCYTEGTRIHRQLETPHGTLTQTWRFAAESYTDFEEDPWIDDFIDQYDALRFMYEDRSYDYEMTEYERDLAAIGEHGVVMLEIPENPLKYLHWLMGPQKALLAFMDHPKQMAELCEIHTAKTVAFIQQVCQRTTYDDCPLLISNDNLDAALFPPFLFDQFLHKHYRAVAEEIHRQGRLFCVHSCGNNWKLRGCIRDSGIDMMEGLTPPDLGDFPLEKARAELGEKFIVEGGMVAHYQEMKTGAREAIDQYTQTLFERMGDKRRFIYSSSCNTSPFTPLENIVAFRDACWKHGQMG